VAAEDDTISFYPFADDDDFPWVVNREDHEVTEIPAEPTPKVPEPALVRGLIVSVLGIGSAVVGRQLGADWVDPFIDLYVIAAPLALAFWIRRHVSPVPK